MRKTGLEKSPLVLLVLLLAVSLFSLSALIGCTDAKEEEQEAVIEADVPPEVVAPVEKTEDLPVFGRDSATAVKLKLDNETNKVIAEIAVKLSYDEVYSESLLPPEARIWLLQTVYVCFEPLQPAAAADGAGADIVLRPLYDVQVTFSGRDVVVFHGLNLSELEEITLCLTSDGMGYVEYLDASGNHGSTLETERALKDAAEAQAVAEAEAAAAAQAAAEAEAAAAAAAAAEAEGQYQYNYSSGGGGSSGGQAQDQCVDDLVLR